MPRIRSGCVRNADRRSDCSPRAVAAGGVAATHGKKRPSTTGRDPPGLPCRAGQQQQQQHPRSEGSGSATGGRKKAQPAGWAGQQQGIRATGTKGKVSNSGSGPKAQVRENGKSTTDQSANGGRRTTGQVSGGSRSHDRRKKAQGQQVQLQAFAKRNKSDRQRARSPQEAAATMASSWCARVSRARCDHPGAQRPAAPLNRRNRSRPPAQPVPPAAVNAVDDAARVSAPTRTLPSHGQRATNDSDSDGRSAIGRGPSTRLAPKGRSRQWRRTLLHPHGSSYLNDGRDRHRQLHLSASDGKAAPDTAP